MRASSFDVLVQRKLRFLQAILGRGGILRCVESVQYPYQVSVSLTHPPTRPPAHPHRILDLRSMILASGTTLMSRLPGLNESALLCKHSKTDILMGWIHVALKCLRDLFRDLA